MVILLYKLQEMYTLFRISELRKNINCTNYFGKKITSTKQTVLLPH